MRAVIGRTGQTFGRLTVVEAAASRGNRTAWKCQCSCGKSVVVRWYNLQSGTTRSCGCLLAELNHRRLTTHGATTNGKRSATYQSWCDARARCNDPRDPGWPNYGGRGIRFCDRWNDFANFLADMGEMPRGMSIERLNNDLGYEPRNCLWIPRSAQAKNKQASRYVTICGQRLLIRDACAVHGIPVSSVWTHRSWAKLTLIEAFFDRLDKAVREKVP